MRFLTFTHLQTSEVTRLLVSLKEAGGKRARKKTRKPKDRQLSHGWGRKWTVAQDRQCTATLASRHRSAPMSAIEHAKLLEGWVRTEESKKQTCQNQVALRIE